MIFCGKSGFWRSNVAIKFGGIERDPEKLSPIRFTKFSPLWFLISIVMIILSVVFMVINANDPNIGAPLKLGIDYTGGDLISGITGRDVTSEEVAKLVAKYSSVDPVVQVIKKAGQTRDIEIRTRIKFDPEADEPTRNTERNDNLAAMKKDLRERFDGFVLKQQDYVGPTVGKELITKAVIALIIGSVLILLYIFIRFGNFIFAVAAIIALLHDVMITLGGVALLKMEINAPFIAVILTIIGYSINDTIIIFDRIRENMKKYPALEFGWLADLSLTQTLTRSIATVLTVIFMLLALIFLGGESIQDFVRALLIGMISGAYSSIFIAAPLVKSFRRKEKVRIVSDVSQADTLTPTVKEVPPEEIEEVEEEPVEVSQGEVPPEAPSRPAPARQFERPYKRKKKVKKGKARRR